MSEWFAALYLPGYRRHTRLAGGSVEPGANVGTAGKRISSSPPRIEARISGTAVHTCILVSVRAELSSSVRCEVQYLVCCYMTDSSLLLEFSTCFRITEMFCCGISALLYKNTPKTRNGCCIGGHFWLQVCWETHSKLIHVLRERMLRLWDFWCVFYCITWKICKRLLYYCVSTELGLHKFGRLVFACPQYGTCFVSPVWCLEFGG